MRHLLRQVGIALITALTLLGIVASGLWLKSHPVSLSGAMPVATLVSIGAMAYGARKKT